MLAGSPTPGRRSSRGDQAHEHLLDHARKIPAGAVRGLIDAAVGTSPHRQVEPQGGHRRALGRHGHRTHGAARRHRQRRAAGPTGISPQPATVRDGQGSTPCRPGRLTNAAGDLRLAARTDLDRESLSEHGDRPVGRLRGHQAEEAVVSPAARTGFHRGRFRRAVHLDQLGSRPSRTHDPVGVTS